MGCDNADAEMMGLGSDLLDKFKPKKIKTARGVSRARDPKTQGTIMAFLKVMGSLEEKENAKDGGRKRLAETRGGDEVDVAMKKFRVGSNLERSKGVRNPFLRKNLGSLNLGRKNRKIQEQKKTRFGFSWVKAQFDFVRF